MSKEIKFRSWDFVNKIMDEDIFIDGAGNAYDYASTTYNTPNIEIQRCDFPVMQYTGLKDKNGVEIYEGDILKVNSPEGIFLGKVVNEIATYGIAAVKGRIIEHFLDNWNDDYLTLLDIYWNNNDDDEMVNSAEVIGNIYENPELLEVSK